MDVTNILNAYNEKHQQNSSSDENFDIDVGYLTVTDKREIDSELYGEDLDEIIQQHTRDGIQALIGALWHQPTSSSPDGPLAILPVSSYPLPRTKPLPKPKAPTKWELFASAKGIQKTKREKKEWDEEKQEWVNTWGWKGKNREAETQWLHEVKMNADADFDPRKAARDERKGRIAKNEKQRDANLARSAAAATSTSRKAEIDGTVAQTRISTASMGKFDRRLEGEKKPRGLKRNFDPTEASADNEKSSSLALLARMDSDAKKMRRNPASADDGVLNVRKAIRTASRGQGGVALGRKKMDFGKAAKGKKSRR